MYIFLAKSIPLFSLTLGTLVPRVGTSRNPFLDTASPVPLGGVELVVVPDLLVLGDPDADELPLDSPGLDDVRRVGRIGGPQVQVVGALKRVSMVSDSGGV